MKNLNITFVHLKTLLMPYAEKLEVIFNEPHRFELQFDKEYTTVSQKTHKTIHKHGLYFAGSMIHKHHVGFYFMPIYSHPNEFLTVDPQLKSLLHGQTCFRFEEITDTQKKEIAELLKKGFEIYQNFDGSTL
jgi:hypothetical protein